MSLSTILREAAARGQHGHSRKPDNYYLTRRDNHASEAGYIYWLRQDLRLPSWEAAVDDATVARVGELSARYRRLCVLAREVWPRWQEVRRIHWADNSIDVVEVDRHGNERQRQVLAPGGDRCF